MQTALADVHETLDQMLALADQLRNNPQITDIVSIGIGGSHLGPEVVVNALEDWIDRGKNFTLSPMSTVTNWAMCCAGSNLKARCF